MIELCHIYKSFGTRKILHDVNLSVNKGETMVVLGASGSGKSTILRLVMGLMRPDSGQVLVEGHDIALMNEEELNRQRSSMGMVFQYSALFDSMTIGDNVAFGLRQHTEMTENEIRSVVKEKLSLVGLEGTEDLMPSSLSGGMKKRVGLARAIALNPEIILYDEPTAGLDPIMSTSISALIRHTQEAMHATSIVVTHDMKSARTIGDRMAFLYEGSFREVGTPEELYRSSDLKVQQFIHGLAEEPAGERREPENEMDNRG
ncbi:MAG TPA: ABC transporter ATP-binding protein [Veillonellaceae bacterium]|nr:ABC transporter ATP-binding protein [Veillonellaceae bacterium]